jgi:hypothetical protein
MRNFLTFLLTFSLFVSCSKKEYLDELEITNESFLYVGIKYAVIDDSSSVITSLNIPTITIVNGTNAGQIYPYNPLIGYDNEVSQFTSEDSESFAEFKDIEVFVPSYIDEDSEVYLGGKKWKYTDIVQKQKSGISISSDVPIPPNATTTISCKLFFRNYKMNYQLITRGDQTGTYKIIEGIWRGTYPDRTEVSIDAQPISK